MKYKIIGIITCILALIISFTIPMIMSEDKGRYHQHLEAETPLSCKHSDNTFCTHLPLLEINTNGEDIPGAPLYDEENKKVKYTTTIDGKEELLCKLTIKDKEGVNHHVSDSPDIESNAYIRIRGNSSRHFDKKGYLLNLTTSSGENNPQVVMGMDAHHEWALHGPFLDKTLIRNYMWYNIAGEIMDYAPNVRFCEVLLNGEYQGLYLMTETIAAGKDGTRLNLEVDKKDNSFSGYCLRLDRGSENELKNISTFSQYTYRVWGVEMNLEYPGTSNLTPEMSENIRQDFSAFEKTIYSFDYDHDDYGYEDTIDADNFVDYLLINEFTCNYDAGSYSTYIYKDIDGKYRMCVWDFNNSCDNYQETAVNRKDFMFQDNIWYFMLLKDKDFTSKIVNRYKELRENVLSEQYINDYIDQTILYLGDAVTRNYGVWGYVFEKEDGLLLPSDRNTAGFDMAVTQLKTFVEERGNWLDENIDIIKQYSAESKAKLYNEHTE